MSSGYSSSNYLIVSTCDMRKVLENLMFGYLHLHLQCVLLEVGVVSAHGFRQRHKKVSASGVFRVFTSLLRDSLIKKGLLYAFFYYLVPPTNLGGCGTTVLATYMQSLCEHFTGPSLIFFVRNSHIPHDPVYSMGRQVLQFPIAVDLFTRPAQHSVLYFCCLSPPGVVLGSLVPSLFFARGGEK